MVSSGAAGNFGQPHDASASEEVSSSDAEHSEAGDREELDDELERQGLQVTKAHTVQFASAHTALCETGAQFFVVCCALLVIPSVMELQVVAKNGFGLSCGIVPDLWLTLDGTCNLLGVLVSVYLHYNRHIIGDRGMSEYAVKKARGDLLPPVDEAFARRQEVYSQVTALAFKATLVCVIASVVSWLVGSAIYLFGNLTWCEEQRFAIRMIFWFRLFLPLLVFCCIIPIQHVFCDNSLLSSVSALDGLAQRAADSEEDPEDDDDEQEAGVGGSLAFRADRAV